jgi:hypothetical protein
MAKCRVRLEVIVEFEYAGDEVPFLDPVINELDYNFISNTPDIRVTATEISETLSFKECC